MSLPTHTDQRIEELEKQVRAAKADVQSAERAFQEHARGLHLARTILEQREQKLAEVRELIKAEGSAVPR